MIVRLLSRFVVLVGGWLTLFKTNPTGQMECDVKDSERHA